MVRENFVTGARDLAALSAVTTFARPPSARGRYSADRTLPAIARTSLNEKLANMRKLEVSALSKPGAFAFEARIRPAIMRVRPVAKPPLLNPGLARLKLRHTCCDLPALRRRHCGAPQVLRFLDSILTPDSNQFGKGDWGCIRYFDLEHPSWEQIIRCSTGKPT